MMNGASHLIRCLVALACAFVAFFAEGAPEKSFSLLIIDSQKGEPYQSVRDSMLKELEKNGFKVGKNLLIKHYSIGNQEGAVRSIWDAEKGNRYDAIFSNGTAATIGLKRVAYGDTSHKIVFGAITDPVGEGVIDRFDAPPKANFTGVSYPVRVAERLRFIKQAMPQAKRIGFIDTEMPQSASYRKWLIEALQTTEFKDLQISIRTVPFVKSEEGHRRMAELAKNHVVELNPQIDVFLGCNDQMCVQQPYAEMVARHATKPFISVGRKEVTDGWGATMSIYPDQEGAGRMVAGMIIQIFKGTPLQAINPRWPPIGYAFDLNKTGHFRITIPAKLIEAAGKDAANVIYVPKNEQNGNQR